MRRTFAVFILVLVFAASSSAQTLFQGRIDALVLGARAVRRQTPKRRNADDADHGSIG